MAELSTTRSNFYKQIYFPSTYYKEVFDLTLEEAKDTQKAQAELQKLLIDADTNLARLSETFRERALSPGQQLQVQADRELLDKEEGDAEAGAAALRKLEATALAEARNAVNLGLQKAKEDFGPVGRNTATYNDTVAAAAKSAMSPYGKRPAIQRAIFNAIAAEFGESEGLLNAGRTVLNDASLDYGKIREAANSPADKAALAALENATAGEEPTTPAGKRAQANLDAMASPFANASTEQTNRVAAGLESDKEDELLRLYLSRLQDKETPGEVTEEEIAADPQLAEAEAVYENVRAKNSYLKSAAKWFSAEYLSSLKTKSNLEKKAATDPFDGLDPYRWAQREALKRGGYTKESLLHLQALTTRPELAPYVNPAFTRLRAEGGLEPRTAAEAAIQEAFMQSKGKLTVAELDSLLASKRSEQIGMGREAAQATRKGARGAALGLAAEEEAKGGDVVKAQRGVKAEGRQKGRDLKATARDVGNMYTDPAAAEDAKAYLLALRLNKAGTPATPDTGTKIEVAVTEADVTPTAKDAAGAAANRAAAAAKATAQKTANAAEQEAAKAQLDQQARNRASTELEGGMFAGTTGTIIEDEVDKTFTDRTPLMQNLKAQQEKLKARQPQPLTDWDKSEGAIVPDPTGPGFSYTRRGGKLYSIPDGVGGIPVEVPVGTRAYAAIESALKTGKVPATPEATQPAATPVTPRRPKAPTAAVAPPVAAPAPVAAPVVVPAPAPAPAAPTAPPAAPPPAPAPVNEATQLRNFIRTGAIQRGTPQYDAAIQRLADLEG